MQNCGTILIVIDGCRPDGIQQAETPAIDSLMARGAWTLNAQSVVPSSTLPCHTSMFRGVTPSRHGITTNTWVPMVRPVPSIAEAAHARDLKTAFVYNWEQLRDLAGPGSLDFSYYRANLDEPEGDLTIARVAAEHVVAEQPDFCFVYLGIVDIAGHRHGWMSAEYIEQIGTADRAIGILLEELERGGSPGPLLHPRPERPRRTRAEPRDGHARGPDDPVDRGGSEDPQDRRDRAAGAHHRYGADPGPCPGPCPWRKTGKGSRSRRSSERSTPLLAEIVRHALDRVPLSIILDDSTVLVNLNYFFLRDRTTARAMAEDRHRRWEDLPVVHPTSFTREFAEWCLASGVRGKFSVVPCPAALGRIDEGLPLFSRGPAGGVAGHVPRGHRPRLRHHAGDADPHLRRGSQDPSASPLRDLGAVRLGRPARGPGGAGHRVHRPGLPHPGPPWD